MAAPGGSQWFDIADNLVEAMTQTSGEVGVESFADFALLPAAAVTSVPLAASFPSPSTDGAAASAAAAAASASSATQGPLYTTGHAAACVALAGVVGLSTGALIMRWWGNRGEASVRTARKDPAPSPSMAINNVSAVTQPPCNAAPLAGSIGNNVQRVSAADALSHVQRADAARRVEQSQLQRTTQAVVERSWNAAARFEEPGYAEEAARGAFSRIRELHPAVEKPALAPQRRTPPPPLAPLPAAPATAAGDISDIDKAKICTVLGLGIATLMTTAAVSCILMKRLGKRSPSIPCISFGKAAQASKPQSSAAPACFPPPAPSKPTSTPHLPPAGTPVCCSALATKTPSRLQIPSNRPSDSAWKKASRIDCVDEGLEIMQASRVRRTVEQPEVHIVDGKVRPALRAAHNNRVFRILPKK